MALARDSARFVPVTDEDAGAAAFGSDLRRLRFKDRALERAFRQHYAKRRVRQFPLVFWVGIIIQIPGALRYRFVLHVGPTDWWHIILSRWNGIAPAVVGLLLCRWRRFERLMPVYMVVYVLYLGYALITVSASVPIGWTSLSTFLVAICIMSRLRAIEAVAVQFLFLGWYCYLTVVVYDRPAGFLPGPLLSLGVLCVFIAAANYMIESSARRDFVLLRLLGDEREKSEHLLLNVLPRPIADRLKESSGTIADRFDDITVLFAAIADSTPNIAKMKPEAAVALLNDVFTAFDRLAAKHGLEKIKTIGNTYMLVGGLPEPRDDHAHAVVAMAREMQDEITNFTWPSGDPLVLRIGINTGPAVAGVIGTSKFAYDLWGDTVNVASRMESHGVDGAIQLSQSTHRRVKKNHRCTQRLVDVKGKGEMSVYVLRPLSANGAHARAVPRKKEVART
jgi:class 3 adenylate cyclase